MQHPDNTDHREPICHLGADAYTFAVAYTPECYPTHVRNLDAVFLTELDGLRIVVRPDHVAAMLVFGFGSSDGVSDRRTRESTDVTDSRKKEGNYDSISTIFRLYRIHATVEEAKPNLTA